ncbi:MULTISPECIES: glycosyltransferase family 2 protein [Zobellia]|uniref:Glycosyltransferase, family GT2 n=1 Tax=Zobellia galactanivorans (strain DSM 12802 / CCUG 47099 / CIP 106680 / NCIMB 13871 / Dsij) TaxID=63186 RepID=G0L4W4_ZOBGA|nr:MULTISPECIES: glycosyltransferase family 2 protein [Zobellia]OWW26825.1 glycosyl transferase [Zobellia sp. OII3]CAZ95803.1 Glycosyltransferase, family GT2 [Zobellia galactanivorans]
MVSIITPVYNSEKYITHCIESVLAQTYGNWEHILVDDCSTDKSIAIISEYAKNDTRIRLLQLESNSGAGIARNTAIEAAKGRYIAFLDSDDAWLPQKLKTQVSFMQDNNYYFTYTAYDKMNELGESLNQPVNVKSKTTYRSALFKNPIGCLTAMYDVDFFGKQYMPEIRKRQDYALWLKLLKKTDAYGLDKILSTYRIGNESISSNKFKLIKYEWRIYREVEGLSLLQSIFYTVSAIILKLKSYIW